MKPVGEMILVLRDVEVVTPVIKTGGGLITELNMSDIQEEISKNKDFRLTEQELDQFKSELDEKTKNTKDIVNLLDTGVVYKMGVGAKRATDEFQEGEKVMFNPHGVNGVKIIDNGVEYAMMSYKSVIANLSRD